jgi:fatty acid desaturase
MALGMRRSSLLYVARYSDKRERAWWIEAACLAVHYTAWLVVPSLIWGPLVAFLVYSGVWAFAGVCLALVFAPAHMGLPIMRTPNHDWEHQLATTRDLELPRVISFFFIGLDYQAEHHLFPRIPHPNLPKAARITRAWCQKNGVVHHSEPYLVALAKAERFMRDAWSKHAVEPDEAIESAGDGMAAT